MDKEEDNDDTFPVESLANALKEYMPSLSADDVIEKNPFSLVIAVPRSIVSLYR